MSLKPIVRACGGDLYAGGRRANIPAPGHSPGDRSVSLWLNDGRLLVHSFGSADWREVVDDLRRRGLLDAQNAISARCGVAAAFRTELSHRQRIETAQRLWSEARPVAGALSELHLRLRRAPRPRDHADLRHHPAVPRAVYAGAGPTLPALLAAIRDPRGALTAVEVTYLDRSGGRAEGLRLSRKTIGVVRAGSAVRLAAPGAALLVGEGVFTALSAGARFGLPAWALLSIRNLKTWRAPAGVRRVLIAADRGKPGEEAAAWLRARLKDQGVGAWVALPPRPFGDWNEAGCAQPPPRR